MATSNMHNIPTMIGTWWGNNTLFSSLARSPSNGIHQALATLKARVACKKRITSGIQTLVVELSTWSIFSKDAFFGQCQDCQGGEWMASRWVWGLNRVIFHAHLHILNETNMAKNIFFGVMLLCILCNGQARARRRTSSKVFENNVWVAFWFL